MALIVIIVKQSFEIVKKINLTKIVRYSLAILICLLSTCMVGQTVRGPVAKFSFNDGKDYDEVSKRKAKLVGTGVTQDRFGNANNALYLFGNENSYINLGTNAALKNKEATISLWIKMELEVTAGKGGLANPILLTKCADREDYYEAYAIYYSLETRRIDAVNTRDSIRQISIYAMNDSTRLSWHHLVISYNHDYLSFYLDGKLEERAVKKFDTQFNPLDSVLIGASGSKKKCTLL